MLIFFHLFIALTVGCILAVLLKNKWAILFCGLGGVLPDIIDKPLGAIFLEGAINLGRIYCHTLVVVGVLFLIGVVLWRYKRLVALSCISVGAFLHQLGDFMWNTLQIWCWPFFGPFPPDFEYYPPIPEGAEILLDVAGWMVAVGTAASVLYLLWYFLHDRVKELKKQIFCGVLGAGLGALIVSGMRYLIMGFFLGSVNADYFKTMFLHELISFSEWAFGFLSLALIVTVLIVAKQVSCATEERVYTALGVTSILLGVLMPIAWLVGIPLDEVYGFPTQLVGVFGLVLGGVILLAMRKRVASLTPHSET